MCKSWRKLSKIKVVPIFHSCQIMHFHCSNRQLYFSSMKQKQFSMFLSYWKKGKKYIYDTTLLYAPKLTVQYQRCSNVSFDSYAKKTLFWTPPGEPCSFHFKPGVQTAGVQNNACLLPKVPTTKLLLVRVLQSIPDSIDSAIGLCWRPSP